MRLCLVGETRTSQDGPERNAAFRVPRQETRRVRVEIQKRTGREVLPINIQEVHRPELNAQLVAEAICLQLEKRVDFGAPCVNRRIQPSVGCKGIKVRCGGRLNGAEMARSEWYLQGRLPLHTLRADIDYGQAEARTTYGVIGVKCWIYNGEILEQKNRRVEKTSRRRTRGRRARGARCARKAPGCTSD